MLLVYAFVLSAVLSLLAGRGSLNLLGLAAAFLAALAASFLASSASRLADSGTIATFRRATAVMFAGDAVWIFCLVCGVAYSAVTGSGTPVANALLFGAFACAGFEFIVIDGAFTPNTWLSLLLAALHPLLTVVAFSFTGLLGSFSVYAAAFGFVASAVLAFFIPALKRRRTGQGDDAVHLFQAFMKTWAARNATSLEEITARHAEKADIASKVIRFRQAKGEIYVVLPGVHPGPFYPVGSYNLPSLVYRKFSESGHVLTLHGPGSHERNLATGSDTEEFVSELYRFAQSIEPGGSPALVRGPIVSQIGRATVSCFAVSSDLVLFVSFAPYGSEDLESGVEDDLASLVGPSGLRVSVVDAHNSIEPKPETLDLSDPAWRELLTRVAAAAPRPFRIACSNSHELGFRAGKDVAEGGLSVLLMEATGKKWALVLADSNNAAPSLRGTVADALVESGFALLEFCTSDSHELSARGMTVGRGYLALGEATPPTEISKTVVELARLADSRLADCTYGSGTLVRRMNALGIGALDEFERVTQSSIGFARRYAAVATAAVLLLLALATAV